MLVNDGIRGINQIGGMQEFGEGPAKVTLFEIKPAEAIEIGAVFGFDFQRFFDHRTGFIQVQISINPHVTQVVIGLCRL